MIQPASVLPSNAPPLRDGDAIYQASAGLLEQPVTRQQHDFGFPGTHETEYLSPSNNRLHQNHLQHQQRQYDHLYHPQPQPRQALRHNYSRGGYPYPHPQLEARWQFEADRLSRRFRDSNQYIKYRQRQAKDDKNNNDEKWPDHLEKAFFYALVRHLPMGRRKLQHKDKQRGRNELIADCIEEITGEARSRKQVSSHIQVLKPFVTHDPLIMKYLSKEDMSGPAGRHNGHHALAYGGGRRLSNYPVTVPPHSIRTTMPIAQTSDSHNIHKWKGTLELFEPLDFQMFIQRKYRPREDGEEVLQRLHTYTQSVSSPLGPDLQMADWHTMSRDFPLLAQMHTQRPIDCNILVAEASLAFPTETWREPGVELGISYFCASRHLPPTPVPPMPLKPNEQVTCHNRFYGHGMLVKDQSGSCDVRLEALPQDRGGVEAHLKFGSTFWARTLGRLANRLLDTSRDNSADVATHLRGVTALQEIIAPSEHGHERILVIHWTFRQSSCAKGRASWRRLLLPSPTSQYSEPLKTERADSVYGYASQVADTAVSQTQHGLPQPALQSPFEYDSGSGSALSSATWPTFSSEGSFSATQHDNVDFSAENSFDFNAGNINIAYDPTLNFDNFDSCGFDFDTTAADFVADPALQEYSQQWCDGFATAFDSQPAVGEGASYTTQPVAEVQALAYDGYSGSYEPHHYVSPHEQQAYGGAGQEFVKDEDALAALADASYLASALGPR